MSADDQAALTLKFEPTTTAGVTHAARARNATDRAHGTGRRLALRRLVQRHHLVDVGLQIAQPRFPARMRR